VTGHQDLDPAVRRAPPPSSIRSARRRPAEPPQSEVNLTITNLESRWSAAHRRYSNNPERFLSVDGSVETWSRELTRPEDLPVECAALLPDAFEGFPYCVRTPALRHGDDDTPAPESFLFLEGETLVVMKRSLAGISVFRSRLGALDALVTETSLLQSCVTFHPRDGEPVQVPFNTVVEDLFAPVVSAFLKVKGASFGEAAQLGAVRPDPLEDLRTRDHKYHAYASEILPEDAARLRFYHPTEDLPGLFSRSRVISSYLLVASDAMLYALSGKESVRSASDPDYSLLVRYLPLDLDSAISVRSIPGEARLRMATLRAGNAAFELPVARTSEAGFAAFARAVQVPVVLASDEQPAFEDQLTRKVG